MHFSVRDMHRSPTYELSTSGMTAGGWSEHQRSAPAVACIDTCRKQLFALDTNDAAEYSCGHHLRADQAAVTVPCSQAQSLHTYLRALPATARHVSQEPSTPRSKRSCISAARRSC